MQTDSMLAILGMALVTYVTRIGGPVLVRLVRGNTCLEACLDRLPGSILVALLAPLVFAAGPAEALAAALTLTVALWSKSMPLALVVGVSVVAILRHCMPI